jgi:hypothetical protein
MHFMQLSRNFPADLVIHEQAVRVPSSATNNEQYGFLDLLSQLIEVT